MSCGVRFSAARRAVLSQDALGEGIGRLSEKTQHRILKFYIEPDESKHEVKYLGSVCDIKNSSGIYEIQTASYEKLVPKLKKFLPENRVTVVCPLAGEKLIHWIDDATGEITEGKRSPKKENIYDAFYRLARLFELINDENLSVLIIRLSVDEYRHLNGWDKQKKRGSTKEEFIPKDIIEEIEFSARDAAKYLPDALGDAFVAKDLQKLIKRTSRYTYFVIRFFINTGVIKADGMRGRAIIYKRIKKDEEA